jgi:hypothetical protein
MVEDGSEIMTHGDGDERTEAAEIRTFKTLIITHVEEDVLADLLSVSWMVSKLRPKQATWAKFREGIRRRSEYKWLEKKKYRNTRET